MKEINKASLKKYVGRYIQIKQANGSVVRGKLVSVDKDRVYIKPIRNRNGKQVTSNWIIGLFLLGIVFVGLIGFGVGFGVGRCFKPCCGIPCNRPCGCKRRRVYRRSRYA